MKRPITTKGVQRLDRHISNSSWQSILASSVKAFTPKRHACYQCAADAREQWIAVFGRNRADLGPGHATELAAREAAHYAPLRPLDQPPAAPRRPSRAAPSVPRPEAERRGPSIHHRRPAPGIGR